MLLFITDLLKTIQELKTENETIESRLTVIEIENVKKEEEVKMQKSSNEVKLSEIKEELEGRIELLLNQGEQKDKEHQTCLEELRNKTSEIKVQTTKCEELNQLIEKTIKDKDYNMKTLTEELQSIQENVTLLSANIDRVTNEKITMENNLRDKEIEHQTCLEELRYKTIEIETKTTKCEELNQLIEDTIKEKDQNIKKITGDLQTAVENVTLLNANVERVTNEKLAIENELQDLLIQQEELQETQNKAQNTIQSLKDEILNIKVHSEISIKALLQTCVKSSHNLAIKAISDSDISGTAGTPAYFMMLAEELKDVLTKLNFVHEKYLDDNNNIEGLTRKVIHCGHLFASIHTQGLIICNNSADIEYGERTLEQIKEWNNSVTKLFDVLDEGKVSVKIEVTDVQDKLEHLTKMISGLANKGHSNEQIGDMVEEELAGMDKSIEEAARKIEVEICIFSFFN